jgi:hypothetical protein
VVVAVVAVVVVAVTELLVCWEIMVLLPSLVCPSKHTRTHTYTHARTHAHVQTQNVSMAVREVMCGGKRESFILPLQCARWDLRVAYGSLGGLASILFSVRSPTMLVVVMGGVVVVVVVVVVVFRRRDWHTSSVRKQNKTQEKREYSNSKSRKSRKEQQQQQEHFTCASGQALGNERTKTERQ